MSEIRKTLSAWTGIPGADFNDLHVDEMDAALEQLASMVHHREPGVVDRVREFMKSL